MTSLRQAASPLLWVRHAIAPAGLDVPRPVVVTVRSSPRAALAAGAAT